MAALTSAATRAAVTSIFQKNTPLVSCPNCAKLTAVVAVAAFAFNGPKTDGAFWFFRPPDIPINGTISPAAFVALTGRSEDSR